jgi:hypothetical protein
LILYLTIVSFNSDKSNQESSFQINIVHIFSQKVLIAAIADSGVEAIESFIKIIHLYSQIFSCLCSKPVKSDKTFLTLFIPPPKGVRGAKISKIFKIPEIFL